MYERLLVAVDHSGISERVLAAAQELAQLSQGEVGCCTCVSASRWAGAVSWT